MSDNDHVKWNPELSPEAQKYAEELKNTYKPLLEAQSKIRHHLSLNEVSAADLIDKPLRKDSDKRVVDLKQIDDLVKDGEGVLTFTLQNKQGEIIDLKPLFDMTQ